MGDRGRERIRGRKREPERQKEKDSFDVIVMFKK